MKILFVAMPFSIHTARWITQLKDSKWEIHLFSSMDQRDLHPTLRGVTYHENFFEFNGKRIRDNKYVPIQLPLLSFIKNSTLKKIIYKATRVLKIRTTRATLLEKVIKKVQPDIIHTLETQHAGYLTSTVKKKWDKNFPVWIHSNWGIDLHFFGKLKEHIPLIEQTLSYIDVFITEGKRDAELAKEFGFQKEIYSFPSVGGGFHIPPSHGKPTSQRKKILVKGMQDIVRRGLVALRSLERCVDLLSDYEIILYSSDEITKAAAALFECNTGKKINILDYVNQEEMLKLNNEARINICINKSDGLPNAMLEAMIMGAFPIQSDTSLSDEWIKHEVNGLIVPPEDPDIIEIAIREALQNDSLVDQAAFINYKLVQENLNYAYINARINKMYEEVLNNSKSHPVKLNSK